jgi:DNA-binding response OmpR family regulator
MATACHQILLIEEEPTLLEITSFRLELLGHEIIACHSALEATEWLTNNTPDLIAVGHFSDMEPLDFLNRMSDDERLSQAAVLYLSPNSDLEEVQRAFNAGADEYLLIPYDPLVLDDKVSSLIRAVDSRPTT